MQFFNSKGQGATEYLVLLAVVLIIGIVTTALLGFFPGFAGGVSESESKIYWQTTSPIKIIDAAMLFSGTAGHVCSTVAVYRGVRLNLQNADIDTMTITDINIVPNVYGSPKFCASGASTQTNTLTMGPGETAQADVVLAASGSSLICNTSDTTITMNVKFNYTRNNLVKTQYGSKPLVLRC